MNKYTTRKNNHYIQAGWTGFGWGYSKQLNPKKKSNRYNKVWALKLDEIFDDDSIFNWPSFQEIEDKEYILNTCNAEAFFYSNNLLLDDLDIDFAKECEDFIGSVKNIEDRIFQHFDGKLCLNTNPFNEVEQKQLIKELKGFIALHLTRQKLVMVKIFSEIDRLFSQEHNHIDYLPSNVTKDEADEFYKYFPKVSDNNYFEFKKIIAYYHLKLHYENILKNMNVFSNIKFVAYTDTNKNILNYFCLSEVPFINHDFFTEEHKSNYQQDFFEFLQKNFLDELNKEYPNLQDDKKFVNDFDSLWNGFIVGVLSKRVKIFITKEKNFLSDRFSDWFFLESINAYDEIILQNSFSSFIGYSKDSLEKLYNHLIKCEFKFNNIKDNYLKIKQILHSKKIPK